MTMTLSTAGRGSKVTKLPGGKWIKDININSLYPNILKNNGMLRWKVKYNFGPDDKVERTEDGNYKVYASNVMEKIEWLTEVFGLGSNNPKSPWRVRWCHMNTYRDFPEASGIIFMKPDMALQYKLRWSGE